MFEPILNVLNELEFLGERYAVGGCVRDAFMQNEAHDIDVAVSMPPEAVMALATSRGYRVVPTGIENGTVTIMFGDKGVEVTTFRRDVQTFGRTVKVEFGASIYEDLARRDFTINAMAVSPKGRLLDPHDGFKDLISKELRTVGNPEDRFKEDYLRIIRLFRFAARFNMEVDVKTLSAAYELGELVPLYVSAERTVSEFNKAFKHDNVADFLRYMYRSGVLTTIFPEFEGTNALNQHPVWHPEGSVFTHVCEVVERAPVRYRWHALLHDIGKKATAAKKPGNDYYSFHGHAQVGAEMIPAIARRLKLPNKLAEEIEVTTRYHMYPLDLWRNNEKNPTDRTVRRYQVAVGKHLKAVEAVVRADRGTRDTEENGGLTEEFMQALFTPVPEVLEPVLMGRHLIARGLKPSKHFGTILKHAFDYQTETGEQDVDKLFLEGIVRAVPEVLKEIK